MNSLLDLVVLIVGDIVSIDVALKRLSSDHFGQTDAGALCFLLDSRLKIRSCGLSFGSCWRGSQRHCFIGLLSQLSIGLPLPHLSLHGSLAFVVALVTGKDVINSVIESVLSSVLSSLLSSVAEIVSCAFCHFLEHRDIFVRGGTK